MKNKIILKLLIQSVIGEETTIDMFIDLMLENNGTDIKLEILFFIYCLNIPNAPVHLINFINSLLTDMPNNLNNILFENTGNLNETSSKNITEIEQNEIISTQSILVL